MIQYTQYRQFKLLSVFDYLLLFVQYDQGQLSTSCMKLVLERFVIRQ